MAKEKEDDYVSNPVEAHSHWQDELSRAEKFLHEFIIRADKNYDLYLPAKDKVNLKFNLFNSNIGILKTALFQRIPKPVVRRRFNDADDTIGRTASMILERVLSYELNQNSNFRNATENIIKDFLVAGAGWGVARYDADVSNPQMLDDSAEHELAEGETPNIVIINQNTDIDFVSYRDVLYEPSRTWAECKWWARRVYMCQDDIEQRFGKKFSDEIAFSNSMSDDEVIESDSAEIWEIWDKDTKKIYWYCSSASEILDVKDDLLGLPNFFPTHPPLFSNYSPNALLAVSDFELLKEQYRQLEEINNRISRLIEAARLAGVYDASSLELRQLLEQKGDTVLVPVQNYQGFAAGGGLANAISFLPLTEIAAVIQQLQAAKQEIQNQIEMISGISDLARGINTNQYESAAASNMKASATNVRLSAKSEALAQALTELIRNRAHFICKFYTDQQIIQRLGVINAQDAENVMPAMQLLRNELVAHFMIEITSDSLSANSFGADSQTKAVLLQQISAYVPQIIQGLQVMPEMGQFYLSMLKWSVAGTRGAEELESLIDVSMRGVLAQAQAQADQQRQAEAQKQQQPDSAQMQLQLQQQQMESSNQFRQMELQMQQEKQQQEFQLKMAQLEFEKFKAQVDTTRIQAELQIAQSKLELQELESGESIKLENRKLELQEETFLMGLQAAGQKPPAEFNEKAEAHKMPDPKIAIHINSQGPAEEKAEPIDNSSEEMIEPSMLPPMI